MRAGQRCSAILRRQDTLSQVRCGWENSAPAPSRSRVLSARKMRDRTAIGSLPFAPEIVLPAIAEMRNRYGGYLYSTYGFRDSFNPSFSWLPKTGKFVPRLGWFDVDYVGIDQGLIIGMVENYRSGLIWKLMRNNPYLRRGLLRAGFTGGWLNSQKLNAAQN